MILHEMVNSASNSVDEFFLLSSLTLLHLQNNCFVSYFTQFYCVFYDCKILINSSVVVFCLHQAKMALKWWLNNYFKEEPGCKTQDNKGCTLSPVAKGLPRACATGSY